MGLPPGALAGLDEDDDAPDQPLPVWPENWGAVQLFLHVGTQWRRDAAGYRYGIDYAALTRPERALGLRGRTARQAFEGLQLLEAEWLRLERAERRGRPAAPPQGPSGDWDD